MSLEAVRAFCLALPAVGEDVKWGNDLCFLVGGKMFAVIDLNPPHPVSFKCTAEDFGELVERPGVRPAPYLARAQWVQEEALGDALERAELERLLEASYRLVAARLPRARRPDRSRAAARARRSERAPAAGRKRGRAARKK